MEMTKGWSLPPPLRHPPPPPHEPTERRAEGGKLKRHQLALLAPSGRPQATLPVAAPLLQSLADQSRCLSSYLNGGPQQGKIKPEDIGSQALGAMSPSDAYEVS